MDDPAKTFSALLSKFHPLRTNSKNGASITTDTLIGGRIRPLLSHEISEGLVSGTILRPGEKQSVEVHELKAAVRGPPRLNSSSFCLDRIYGPDEATESVYNDLVAPLLPFAWGGGVGTLFAYGQTGSGKTYTISSIEKIVARELLGGSLNGGRSISVSIFELAGNSAFDLLNDRHPITIVEDTLRSIQLLNCTSHPLHTPTDLLHQIDLATSFRRTASTSKNDASSRSHAICRIRIANTDDPATPDGLLYLVDLAGSEAARDVAGHGADRMKETREINASLAVLKECIRGRAVLDAGGSVASTSTTSASASASASASTSTAKKPFIPFRQSALTKALKHVFDPEAGRACRTAVVACVNPSFLDAAPSRNTLRYAEMLRVAVTKTEREGEKVVVPREAVPSTWTNGMVRDWVLKNSGKPAIDPAILAPFETGAQLIRLPEADFLARCLQCPGISDMRAKAVYTKFWSKHIDSQKAERDNQRAETASRRAPKMVKSSRAVGQTEQKWIGTEQKGDMAAGSAAFKERIRPGMVVRFKPRWEEDLKVNLAVVMCPEWAVEVDGPEQENVSVGRDGKLGKGKYLCALVQSASMAGAYTVGLWTQVTVAVEDMEEEVFLEYDPASRFYYLQKA